MKLMNALTFAASVLGLAACATRVGSEPVAYTDVGGRGSGIGVNVTTTRGVSLRRGESAPVVIDISRYRTSGPVYVTLDDLPSGVSVDDKRKRVETTQATFVVKASRKAGIVENHLATLTIEGPDGTKATEFVELDVWE